MKRDEIREFDAHIYFSDETIASAKELRERVIQEFLKDSIFIGQLVNRKVGPHPTPMFELNFKREYYQTIMDWLIRNRGQHSVLIHPVTGNDFQDHTDGIIWLGKSLSLDFSKFSK